MHTAPVFEPHDLETMRLRGLPVEEVVRQLERIRHGSGRVHLLRAATIEDGIERLDEREAGLDEAGREAIAAGRCTCFVPASGAATRMFQDLIAARDEGIEIETDATRRFLDALPRFAFHDALARTLERRGLSIDRLGIDERARPILEALLDDDGLGYANAPKGMIGPNLANVGARSYIGAGSFKNTDETLARWIQNPQAMKKGVLMPNLGVTPEEAKSLVAFLRAHQ